MKKRTKILIGVILGFVLLITAGVVGVKVMYDNGYQFNLGLFSKSAKAIKKLEGLYPDYKIEYYEDDDLFYIIEYTDKSNYILDQADYFKAGVEPSKYDNYIQQKTDICIAADKVVRQIDEEYRTRFLISSMASTGLDIPVKEALLLVDSKGMLKYLEDFVED